jgi:hypothetical protein
VDQFSWTGTALTNLEGITLTDVADVLYAKPANVIVRSLSNDGRIIFGRAEGGAWVAVLLVRDSQLADHWNISYARAMTRREIKEWYRWKSP